MSSRMHNPVHPGEVLREWIPQDMTVSEAANSLHIDQVSLANILNGHTGVTADIALRLSAWLGTSADLWLGMQNQWDLWQASRQPRPKIKPLARDAA
jgi:antitoxin HigA-1